MFDVILGTYSPASNSISDYHSLLPVSPQSSQIIASYLASTKSTATNHAYSSQGEMKGHGSDLESKHRGDSSEPVIASPHKYLSEAACEQLKHGLNPRDVQIFPLDFSQFRDIAQDPRTKDTWILFLHGPWSNKTGGTSFSFAISRVNPRYVEINGQKTPLAELLPPGSGNIDVQIRVVPIERTKTSGQLVNAFPFLTDHDQDLRSDKIIPFSNNALSVSSSVSADSFKKSSTGASLPFAVLGILMSLAIAGLAYRLQSYFDTRHELALVEGRTDSLTRIPNRRFWDEQLRSLDLERLNIKIQFYVLIIDLNSFKQINDSLGHEYGDQLLQKTADSLKSALRGKEDFVARLGGDEFGMIFRGTNISPQALVGRIKKQLEKDGIKAAVGIGSTSVQRSLKDAWSDADREMYTDKKQS